MLQDMPLGSPTLSLETNLNKIFGFVYGEITCPDEQTLKVPFIQYKDSLWNMNNCPRGKFSRLIFSEEIKYALKYGYSIDVFYCWQFERGKDLFKQFIEDHYKDKLKATDPVQRATSKLFLNSLYGRFGMKEIDSKTEIVNKQELEYLDKNTNISIISELNNNQFLVRYSNKISGNIRRLYLKDPLISVKNKTISYSKDELKKSGFNKSRIIPSAIHIAAATAAYARIEINEYKNISNNPCVMSDTDSVVLTKPLPAYLVSRELGKMKLEHEIKKGIFIRKKLYCIVNSNGKLIVKSSGIDSNKLNSDSFEALLRGEPVIIERTNFNVEWKTLNINVVKSNVEIQGLVGKVKTNYNMPDVNFKYISFPIKYQIIVHSLYPIAPVQSKKVLLKNYNFRYTTMEKLEVILFILIILSFFFMLLYQTIN